MRDRNMLTFSLLVAVLLLAIPLGCGTMETPYMAEATRYTDEAIRRGMRQDSNGIAEQASIALRYVYMMQRELREHPSIQQVIVHLKAAVLQARYGRSAEAVSEAERAAQALADIEQQR